MQDKLRSAGFVVCVALLVAVPVFALPTLHEMGYKFWQGCDGSFGIIQSDISFISCPSPFPPTFILPVEYVGWSEPLVVK